ncbi:deoxyribonuclease IV [Mycolicibacterium tokaiense]|uniref:Endonuclease IV n=1 Tax=Mycolicibacterium tokaiense TaxID=39695 RepID=A0A378TD36_9MYCO|nr:deoxyribonuclease IV [Mycolicibacterium tokaiense]ANW62963.1 deoxyribonuclease IV [Mycobacterium sp. djl-10]BBY86816.1 deoxyribonuclease IV [Mycolicibacterium tokaiense]STZ58679.1 endonuclease IV [Mycolicibacterium tokaiense]
MALLGAHVDSADPLSAAQAIGAEAVQFFMGDPQGWKKPPPHPHAEALRDSDVTIYIHAPYLINVASTNNKIRIPSRKMLLQHAEAAAGIGAKGLIVHGGHVTAKDDPAVGIENWRKAFERQEEAGGFPLPILIENTAGGENAMARKFDRLAMLWDAVGQYEPGFVLDTCHAWAGGEELDHIVDRVKAITGRIDLIHANNSRDGFDSGADRHANFDAGTFDSQVIADICRAAGSDVIIETPGEGIAADLEYLRTRAR